MQCDRLSDETHVPVKTVKPGMDLVKLLPQEVFDRRGWAQKTFKRILNDHALADAWAVDCSLELFEHLLGKLDGDFSGSGGFVGN
ncbi:hypothetical protein [Bradyrhizobium sp. sGM-13]|uniref:hypothetical protein n=1 Tax=Bradyrhizobium sp. sGM-13 TaxID=2831781 RepID=UPI001BD1BC40|nr:hypothetical protein [Bradyrhizobium sp. sGM-13]